MIYFHASDQSPEIGTVFRGRGQAYDDDWNRASFYRPLEHYRPASRTSHKDAVFLCKDVQSIGYCGGLEETILLMKAGGPVSWHDMNWSTEISSLVSSGFSIDSVPVRRAAEAYWSGRPFGKESVWEGIAKTATVVAVFDYWEEASVLERARNRLGDRSCRNSFPFIG